MRGQEAAPAFDVAPDWDSYDFKKLDPKSSQDRAFLEDQWAWDKPVEVNGKKVHAYIFRNFQELL